MHEGVRGHSTIDPELYRPDAANRLEAELLDRSRVLLGDDPFGPRELFDLLTGYADHLVAGLVGAGFEETEAKTTAWQTVWKKHHSLLQAQTFDTNEISTIMDRSIGYYLPSEHSDVGEPLNPAVREFYRCFIKNIDHPSVHPTAAWLD